MGGGDLLATREARDIQSLIRFLANPGDDIALIAVLRGPFFALSDRILLRVVEETGNRSTKGHLVGAVAWIDHCGGEAGRRPAWHAARKVSVDRSRRLIRMADRLTGIIRRSSPSLPNSAPSCRLARNDRSGSRITKLPSASISSPSGEE
jgi:ATP-dependent helicase/nuclease subunit A